MYNSYSNLRNKKNCYIFPGWTTKICNLSTNFKCFVPLFYYEFKNKNNIFTFIGFIGFISSSTKLVVIVFYCHNKYIIYPIFCISMVIIPFTISH